MKLLRSSDDIWTVGSILGEMGENAIFGFYWVINVINDFYYEIVKLGSYEKEWWSWID